MPALSSVRLGRLPHDPAAIARAPQLTGHPIATMKAPARLDRSHIAFAPQMDGNQTLCDCTAVAMANAMRGVSALGMGAQIDIPAAKTEAFFGECAGIADLAKLASCEGLVMLDVMARQQRYGFDTGAQERYSGYFATIDPGDLNALRAVATFAGLPQLGVDLSMSDQAMEVWDTEAPASAGDPTPGSWGPHALALWDYSGLGDTDTIRLATFGTLQLATWRWIAARLREAHIVNWRSLQPIMSANFAGINRDTLAADCAAWAGS